MISNSRLISKLFGEVGFNQPTISEYAIVDSANQESRSGYKFQDASSFVTVQNIKDSQQDSAISDVVFNTYLGSLQNECIASSVAQVVSGEGLFMQSANLYPYTKDFNNTITPTTKAVGFRIRTPKRTDIGSKISWIELSFDADATFDVHLYNTNKKDPIQTQSVTVVAGESTVVEVDWNLTDQDEYKGGSFYLVYFEDDLAGTKAYKKDFEHSNVRRSTTYYDVVPVSMAHTGNVLDFAHDTESTETFGLNFGIDIYNDYTELVVRNKQSFARIIQLTMGVKVLNLLRNSIRSNTAERINKSQIAEIVLELYGDEKVHTLGLMAELQTAILTLKKQLFKKSMISKGTLR
jgi:hypothetical protein